MSIRAYLFIITLLSTVIAGAKNVRYYEAGDSIEYDTIPYMIRDEVFEESFKEMTAMFDGKEQYSLKRAEFLVENAFFSGRMDYRDFCHDIDSVVAVLNHFIDINDIRKYRTGPNFALFDYFTKSSAMNGNRKFTYDFDDPMGEKDFTIFFTSRLLRTHKGQCTSMPLLYKILCDELGGECALAFGPMHMYIKHIGEDGRWYNVELTHGGFSRDIWYMETMNISTEAIRNGIFLCALSEKENIGFMLMQLARAYHHKYKSYDYFVSRCIETVLTDLPNFCDALVMKFILLQDQGFRFQDKYGHIKTPYITAHYNSFKGVMDKLDHLGYSQPTDEELKAKMEEGIRYTQEHSHE